MPNLHVHTHILCMHMREILHTRAHVMHLMPFITQKTQAKTLKITLHFICHTSKGCVFVNVKLHVLSPLLPLGGEMKCILLGMEGRGGPLGQFRDTHVFTKSQERVCFKLSGSDLSRSEFRGSF